MRKILLLLPLAATALLAESPGNPLSSAVQNQYNTVKTNITKAADKMPDAAYAFKATDEVRSFGQIVGHVANANYYFCSAALAEKSPSAADIEKTATDKAKLVAALKESFDYCDKAYNGLTDASAAEMVKFGPRDMARLGVLTFNNMHDSEHYGNLVTYMRLKNLVPPSSEARK